MGHGKETPRQKMIGLMYLFLTALMALNVSKDVLNAFVNVGHSLEKTIHNYESKNEKLYAEFEKQNAINPDKVGQWKVKSDEVKNNAESLFKMLESHKVGLATYAEGPEAPSVAGGKFHIDALEQKDNIDLGGEYFGILGQKHGGVIEEEIDKYRELLLKIVEGGPEDLINNIKATLATDPHTDKENIDHPWWSHTFEHHPLIACFVMLSKLQTDVKNMETDVVNYLFNQITAGDFKVNAMEAIVIPNSSYVIKGEDYTADVFLAAYDSTQAPTILIGDYKRNDDGTYEMVGTHDSLIVEGGKGIYKVRPNRVGTGKWGGLIRIKKPDGGYTAYPFDKEYEVAVPSLVVSPTKMNVFYSGIDNPVAISVPGFSASDINASISGGGASIKKSGDTYIVKPTKKSGKVDILVSVKIDGKSKSMGTKPFRIKPVPPPVAKVLGNGSGKISKTSLKNAPYVAAVLEDFLFDLKFTVTKFTLVTQDGIYSREYTSNSNKFTNEQRSAINKAKRGSRITIEDIEAKMEGGKPQPLSPIVFKLK